MEAELDRELFEAACAVREHSYSPYSRFAVGAAVRAADGRIFTGCNVENASYGLTLCAERCAIFAAVKEGVREFAALCVTADTPGPVSPCGACRQVMLETEKRFKHPMRVLLFGKTGIYELGSVGALLPLSFDASSML